MAALDASSLASVPKTTSSLEEKFATLEEKFAALEKRYHDLHEKAFTITEKSTGKSAEITVAQVAPSTNGTTDSNNLPAEKDASPSEPVKILISRIDPKTGERKDYPPSDLSSETNSVNVDTHALTLRKYIDEDPEENAGEIEITSQDLWTLLKKHLGHHPYHTFRGPPVVLNSPYQALVFNWEILKKVSEELAEDDANKKAKYELKNLLETISSGSGDAKLDKYFKTRESNKVQNSVTFDTLWTLFPPGTLVYGKPFQEQDQVFIVQDNIRTWPVKWPERAHRGNVTWSILCWIYDWDGTTFRRMSLELVFEHFDGLKPIVSLLYYPLEFNENSRNIKTLLIERGAAYKRFCTTKEGSRMFDYNGEAIFVKRGFSGVQGDDDEDDNMSRPSLDPEVEFLRRRLGLSSPYQSGAAIKSANVDSRVMVDFESYFRYGPTEAQVGSLMPNKDYQECQCSDCRENQELRKIYRTRFDEQNDCWEEEQYMLCPPRVLGYILRDKQWAQLRVTSLKSIPKEDSKNSWSSRLKLADGEATKQMILELVNGHGTSESAGEDGLEVDDIVARKGKGLVILLYGPPGVGKTSTAETVAIAARKPLFSISVADVGTRAKKVESNLAKIFALATSWHAILLIDEADVFLESRGKGVANNTERNALVSVFLRVLEYYQGILMLTTNQIAQFDVAVQSRIHVAIKYGNLNKEQTIAIFEGFLKPLADRGLVKGIDDIREWLDDDVCKMGFDGRQIRNIITSALGLARATGSAKLEKKHIKKMLMNVKEFKDEFVRQFERYKNEQQGMIG